MRAYDSRPIPDWGIEELPGLLAPLLDECRRQGLPGVTDARQLAESLHPYSAAQVTAAARQLAATLASGAPMRSPIAILVAKARDNDPYCFPPARPAAPPPAPVVEALSVGGEFAAATDQAAGDAEAARAVATLGDAELAALDAAVAERVATLPAAARRNATTYGRELWRRLVWREQRCRQAS